MSAEVARVLRAALARFDGGKRWAKEDDPAFTWPYVCAVLALQGDDEALAESALAEIIGEQYPDRLLGPRKYSSSITGAIITFNDHPDTTFDDIRVVYEKAIALEEEAAP